MEFRPAYELQPAAERRLAAERERISGLVPDGELTLTGASSLPDILTSGDIDLHLRVPAAAFEDAVGSLRRVYDVVHPAIWQDGFAAFAVPGAAPPTGVALTVEGGEHDRRFRDAWTRLGREPALRAELNALKRAHAAGPAEAYLAAKAAFFDRLSG